MNFNETSFHIKLIKSYLLASSGVVNPSVSSTLEKKIFISKYIFKKTWEGMWDVCDMQYMCEINRIWFDEFKIFIMKPNILFSYLIYTNISKYLGDKIYQNWKYKPL